MAKSGPSLEADYEKVCGCTENVINDMNRGGSTVLKTSFGFCPPLPTILYIDFSMPVDFRPFYDRHTKAPPIAPRGYLQIFGLVIGEEDDPT